MRGLFVAFNFDLKTGFNPTKPIHSTYVSEEVLHASFAVEKAEFGSGPGFIRFASCFAGNKQNGAAQSPATSQPSAKPTREATQR